jgi:hypothetical protein
MYYCCDVGDMYVLCYCNGNNKIDFLRGKEYYNLSEVILKENNAEIIINSKKHGNFVIEIDSDNFKSCSEFCWSIDKYCNNFYASNKKVGLLHRYLIGAKGKEEVDHIDGNTLNNKLNNLRITDRFGNMRNRKLQSNNSSGKAGVTRHNGKWIAHIKVNNSQKTLGYYDSFEEACQSREKAEQKYFGDFVRKNL